MPELAGHKGLNKSGRQRGTSTAKRGVLGRQKVLSRTKSIRRLKQLLTGKSGIPAEAIEIITLFHLHVDELTEAGIPYEIVRALEKHYPLLLFS